MRNPKNVLESLTSKAASKDYHYQRLYRNLYNPAFYLLAYERNENRRYTRLTDRLQGHICEFCGAETEDIEIHHVRKLKDLSGKAEWERQMIARKRKTMALCHSCHVKLHNGKLD